MGGEISNKKGEESPLILPSYSATHSRALAPTQIENPFQTPLRPILFGASGGVMGRLVNENDKSRNRDDRGVDFRSPDDSYSLSYLSKSTSQVGFLQF
ncbi:hypothetical protein NPIL_344251 [Nephila pilipes]|uniref:Uncharacterized protein n=1 Tax=Nephila pilipes TaxID=299642 RepID=A0A8X6TUV0_NEPPI|nr:hypothetical protein NPIL_344251 [Nephila pilipes]